VEVDGVGMDMQLVAEERAAVPESGEGAAELKGAKELVQLWGDAGAEFEAKKGDAAVLGWPCLLGASADPAAVLEKFEVNAALEALLATVTAFGLLAVVTALGLWWLGEV
jgi:hypothetical protein